MSEVERKRRRKKLNEIFDFIKWKKRINSNNHSYLQRAGIIQAYNRYITYLVFPFSKASSNRQENYIRDIIRMVEEHFSQPQRAFCSIYFPVRTQMCFVLLLAADCCCFDSLQFHRFSYCWIWRIYCVFSLESYTLTSSTMIYMQWKTYSTVDLFISIKYVKSVVRNANQVCTIFTIIRLFGWYCIGQATSP